MPEQGNEIHWRRRVPTGNEAGVHTHGGFFEWRHGGVDVLFPRQTLTLDGLEKERGSHVCVPIHGAQPEGLVLPGCNLPQHGLVRRQEATIVERSRDLRLSFEHQGGKDDKVFVWPFWCDLLLSLTENGFSHTITVTHSGNGVAEYGPMPLGVGLHPYFSTFGGPFQVLGSGWNVFSSDPDVVPGESITKRIIPGRKVEILTSRGVITLVPGWPYEQAVLWSDCPEHYFCFEPVVQRKTFGTEDGIWLRPGESQVFQCSFHYEPA